MALIIDENGFKDQMTVLQAASVVDGELGKRLREAIFQEMKAARDRVVNDIHFANGDPRKTANAVKRYVAGKYLGGVLSILDGKKSSGNRNSYEAPRKVYPGMKGHRGGNRRLRSQRTQEILDLPSSDRGFILRFVNSGTNPRYAAGRNGKWSKNGSNATFGKLQEEGDYFRGSIAPRNFFGQSGERELLRAMNNLSAIIDDEFEKVFV